LRLLGHEAEARTNLQRLTGLLADDRSPEKLWEAADRPSPVMLIERPDAEPWNLLTEISGMFFVD